MLSTIVVQTCEALNCIKQILSSHFSSESTAFVDRVFERVGELFEGQYPGYQASDTTYHDFTHTCEATVAVVRIVDGHLRSGKPPNLTHRDLELMVVASFLHDSGFIKEIGDDEGTGAKYTLTHVTRSGVFAAKFLEEFDVTPDEVRVVQLAIECTGIQVDVDSLPFNDDRERFIGCVVGTGDVLGQMAAPDYPEKLDRLYREFAEAATYPEASGTGIDTYTSVIDLMTRTRGFYKHYVQLMLETQWGGVYQALEYPFEGGENDYFQSIDANLDRIDQMLEAT
ncbi:MAG: hypothetical protein VYC91_07015 [Acidobacteriota bacterium]|nr:hypothetical protein [Acidobacteriota bacterium]